MEKKKNLLQSYLVNIEDQKLKKIITQVLAAEKMYQSKSDKIRAIKKIIENENK